MPLPSLLRIITSLSCTVTLFAGLILDPESMMVHANGSPPELIEPPGKIAPVEVPKYEPLEGATYNNNGTISVYPGIAYPGSPAFMKYLVNDKEFYNHSEPWSKRYSPLHPHLVRHACNIVFNGTGKALPSKIIYGNMCKPKYKSLIVFIPDDVYMADVELKLEFVQGVIFSVMLSGVFEKSAEVTIVTSVPKLDAKGVPLNALPLRTFNIEDACNSLADDHEDKNMIRFIMSEMVKKETKAKSDSKLENDKMLPLTLVQAWYQISALFSPNSEFVYPSNVFSIVQNYYNRFEGEPPNSEKVKHMDYEVTSLYGISEESVVLIFGNNDAYAELLHKGAIGTANLLGIEHYDRKMLNPLIGVNDLNFSIPKNPPYDARSPLFCPRVCVNNHDHIPNDTCNVFPIFKEFIQQYNINTDYLEIETPAIVKNCHKYAHFNRLNEGKQQCTLYVNSFADFSDNRCNGSTAANEQLAGLISMTPPRKIIQIQLGPDLNNHIYNKINNTDSLTIQQTVMGCPDLLPVYNTNKYPVNPVFDKVNRNSDESVLTVCAPPEKRVDDNEELLLRSNSFAQAYVRAQMMNNDASYIGYTGKGCSNSVLTLYASADERSMFHYPVMSNYFNTIINAHLNEPCIGNDDDKSTFGDVSLWRHDCEYYPNNNNFKCSNLGNNKKLIPAYTEKLLSVQNGLYTWYNAVDCRKFEGLYSTHHLFPQNLKCMLNNMALLRKVKSLDPNLFVHSRYNPGIIYD